MTDSFKVQVNFKNGVPDLVNVRADSAAELAQLLDGLALVSPNIEAAKAVLVLQQGGLNPTVVPPAPSTAGGDWNSQPPAPPAPPAAPAAGGGPACQHGGKVWKEGQNKAGRPYKGWFCPANVNGCAPTWA